MMQRRARPQETTAAPMHLKVPDALVQRFFTDLEAAEPLSALPKKGCVKSVSFGTSLTIEFGDQRSPDLSCPNADNLHVQTLLRDSNEIIHLFRPN